MASWLVELKSKQAVPRSAEADGADGEVALADESSGDLVARLVEYRRIRDASSLLDEQAGRWQLHYTRLVNAGPPRRFELGEQPIAAIEVWDLVSAFGRILREQQPPPSASIIYDDTPIHVYMQRIHGRVREQGRVELTSLFEPGMHKSSLVALFLATLELARHHGLETEQREPGLPLTLVGGPGFQPELEVHQIDNLSFEQVAHSNLPIAPR